MPTTNSWVTETHPETDSVGSVAKIGLCFSDIQETMDTVPSHSSDAAGWSTAPADPARGKSYVVQHGLAV